MIVLNYTSEDIVKRLISRYNLQGYPIEPAQTMVLQRQIVPITNVDELLKKAKNAIGDYSLVAAAGTYIVYHTVPGGKRWTVKRCYRDASIGTTEVHIFRVATALNMPWGGSGTAAIGVEMYDVVLNEGDTMGLTTTGNGADTNIYLWADYEEEDAF